MSATTASNANYVFQNKYLKLVEEAKRRHPILDRLIAKASGGLGATTINTVEYGNDQGAAWGSNFSTAQNNTSQTQGMQFTIPVRNGYRVCQISRVALQLSKSDAAAYDSLITRHIKAATNGIYDDLGFFLFRDGGGARGRRSGALSGNTVTLYNKDDCRNFYRGMTVKAGVSTSSLRTGTTTVVNVDPDAGTVTLADQSQLSGFLADDYLFREGETGSVVMDGFDVLNPLTAPSPGESFRGSGNDRTFYTPLLAGARLSTADAAGLSIEERAMTVATRIYNFGGMADTLVLNPTKALEVVLRQTGKMTLEGGKVANFGFTGVKLHSHAGSLEIVADPDCPPDQGRILRLEDWVIKYAGSKLIEPGAPKEAGGSGNTFFYMKDGSDNLEGRWSVIANLYCEEPRNQGVFPVA